jgi:hypothetical protein
MTLRSILLATCLVLLGPSPGIAASATPGFSGTWSGSFEIHFADGHVDNQTAWLVLEQAGKSVTGTGGPRPDQLKPISDGVVAGKRLTFNVESSQGKTLRVTLERKGDGLTGEAVGEIGADKVRAVLNLAPASSASAAPPDPLYQKILALDTEMFTAFNTCTDPAQLAKHESFFVKELEFYHDLGGASFTRDYMKGVHDNVCGKFHRELELATFRVWPIKGYGALSQGTHRFCHSPTTCEGVGQFTMIWRETDGKWEVTRTMSYDHREEHVPAKARP